MKKVVKFGGSSLASAEQFKKVGDIIRADEGRRYVVPSAPGKRNSADTKVTDMLYDCYRTAVAGRDFKKKLQNIKARYQEIIDGLNLSLDLSPEFEKIAENFAAAAGEDYAASRGEYLNGIVMANYLGYTYIPDNLPSRYRSGTLRGMRRSPLRLLRQSFLRFFQIPGKDPG